MKSTKLDAMIKEAKISPHIRPDIDFSTPERKADLEEMLVQVERLKKLNADVLTRITNASN